jgi:hypothetical protein
LKNSRFAAGYLGRRVKGFRGLTFSDRKGANGVLRDCNAFADPEENVRLRLPE